MPVKTKIMTATEARHLARVHGDIAEQMVRTPSNASLTLTVEAIGLAVIGKFLGSVTGGVSIWHTNFK